MSKVLLLAASLTLWLAATAAAVTNPHIDTADSTSCLACHTEGFEQAASGEYTLLKDTIDAVCLMCHVKAECCFIGRRHMDALFIGYSHPSDLDARDISPKAMPKTLPLQDGRMTCNTCHFHRRPAGQDYKLVRLVEFTDKGPLWTSLCMDCHEEM